MSESISELSGGAWALIGRQSAAPLVIAWNDGDKAVPLFSEMDFAKEFLEVEADQLDDDYEPRLLAGSRALAEFLREREAEGVHLMAKDPSSLRDFWEGIEACNGDYVSIAVYIDCFLEWLERGPKQPVDRSFRRIRSVEDV